jgi:hypothetical protein
LVAKVLCDSTSQSILVVCFTNHALDQFLEDLIDIGIPTSDMIRLGGKSTDRTKPLTLYEQPGSKLTPSQWDKVNKLELRLQQHEDRLRKAFDRYRAGATKQRLMEYLEFALEESLPFFEAFSVPTGGENGMIRVGRKGKAVDPFYLLDRWTRGTTDAGAFKHIQPEGSAPIWRMTPDMRQSAKLRWQKAILKDLVTEVHRLAQDFNRAH